MRKENGRGDEREMRVWEGGGVEGMASGKWGYRREREEWGLGKDGLGKQGK